MTISAFVLAATFVVQGAQAPPSSDTTAQAYLMFLQARALESAGDTNGAISAYRQAIQQAPNMAELHAQLANLFAREGRADESVAEAVAALKIDPANRDAHRTLGFVQAALAESATDESRSRALVTEALGHFEQIAAAAPLDPAAQLTLGRLYVRAGQNAKAIKTLTAFLAGQPGYPEGLALLAEAYTSDNQPEKAIGLWEQAVAAEPNGVPARVSLAEAYEEAGRWPEAAAAWAEVVRRSPRTPQFRTRQANALANGGDLAQARQKLNEITTATPADAAAWFLLSEVERRSSNFDAAEDAARKVIALNIGDSRGALALAAVKSTRQDYQGAIAVLAPLVKTPAARDAASGVLNDMIDALAAAYEHAGDLDSAEKVFRDILAAEPQNMGALNSLGYLLADHGRKLDEAVSLVTRALALDPDNPAFLDSLGWAYLKQAKLDLARPPLERAAAGLASSSVVQDHVAEMYFQLKRYRDAANAWDRALAGDGADIDVAAVTKKRDKARELAGR